MLLPYKPLFTYTQSIKNNIEEIDRLNQFAIMHQLNENIKKISLYQKNEQDIQAYVDARKEIMQRKNEPITKKLFQEINGIILRLSTPAAFNQNGSEIKNLSGLVVYYSPIWAEVDTDNFLNWLNSSDALSLHPLVYAAIAHYQFIKIHPFDEGNGRTARLFSTLILLKKQYCPCFCFALEQYWEDHKELYYKALDFRKPDEFFEIYDGLYENDLTPWIKFFCKSFVEATKNLTA